MSTEESSEEQKVETQRDKANADGGQQEITKGLRRAVINLISKGFSREEVAKITGLAQEQIEQIEDEYE